MVYIGLSIPATTKFTDKSEGEGRFGFERRSGSSVGDDGGCIRSLRGTAESTGIGFRKCEKCELEAWLVCLGKMEQTSW